MITRLATVAITSLIAFSVTSVYANTSITDYFNYDWDVIVFDTFLEYDGICFIICFSNEEKEREANERVMSFTAKWLERGLIPYYMFSDEITLPSNGWRVVLDDCAISLFGGHTAYVDYRERNMKFCAGFIDTMITDNEDRFNHTNIMGALDFVFLHEMSHIIRGSDFGGIYDNEELNTDLLALYIIYRQYEDNAINDDITDEILNALLIILLDFTDKMVEETEEDPDDIDEETLERYTVTSYAITMLYQTLHKSDPDKYSFFTDLEIDHVNNELYNTDPDMRKKIIKTFKYYDLTLEESENITIQPRNTDWDSFFEINMPE